MKKAAKLACILVGTLLVALLAASLIGRLESAGGFTRKISRTTDNLLYFLRLKQRPRKFSLCISNLQNIQISKEMWADNEHKTINDTPTWNDLQDYWASRHYLKNGVPICPDGGTYRINPVGERPTCSCRIGRSYRQSPVTYVDYTETNVTHAP